MKQQLSTAVTEFAPPPRRSPPPFPTADLAIAAPPSPPPARTAPLVRLLPVVVAMATVVLTAALWRSGTVTRSPTFLLFPITMLLSGGVMTMVGRGGGAADLDAARGDYLDYLGGLRRSVTKTAAAQHRSLIWCHPDPAALWTMVGGDRMWERRSGDSDFCHARIGVATQRLATRLVAPETGATGRTDPVTVAALHRFIRAHCTVRGAPIAVALRGLAAVTLAGDTEMARGLLRAMLCQLAVLHGPDRLLIAAAVSVETRTHWEWLKWLPHNRHPETVDESGGAPMVYPSLSAVDRDRAVVGHDALPHLVVVVDGAVVIGDEEILAGRRTGVTLLVVGSGCDSAAIGAGLRLRVSSTGLAVRHDNIDEVVARPDFLTIPDAVTCARRLTGYRPPAAAVGDGTRWQDLMGIAEPAGLEAELLWGNPGRYDRLRIPIGVTADGAPVELDIKEAAEHGIGPHGLCIGATGSGKSEFLRTVVLGMIARHGPDELNLVLVDFKGGATFGGLERVRHVAAHITNLADEAPLVARMRDALTGELVRRQELLRSAGNISNIAEYQRLCREGLPVPPLARLLIIVDEFSELLSQQPDFIEVFGAIGRLGRSLGIHLLLASQRLEEGRLRGLESHLSYRVCLKTLTAAESRIVLGVPDAHQLPNTPGIAYLQCGTADLIKFQTAFVSGRCTAPSRSDRSQPVSPPVVQRFDAAPGGPPVAAAAAAPSAGPRSATQTVLQTVVGRLSGHGRPAHQIWLEPLGAPPALSALLDDTLLAHPLLADTRSEAAGLKIPIGVIDCPFEQRRIPLLADLSGAAGNVAIVGAPQSGKSTALRTVILALAATHDPGQVQIYGLDFGGGSLTAVRALPHVGAVGGRTEPELVRRTVAELEALAAARETMFAAHGIESMSRYRQLRGQRDPVCAGDPFGDVFFVIDGWSVVRQDFENLEEPITALAGRGLSVGVHVILSASRWAEIRPALKDHIGTRLELRLGDPGESELGRIPAQQVPPDRPGRGLCRDGRHMVLAAPRLTADDPSANLAEADSRAAVLLRARYGTRVAPPVRLLPAQVNPGTVAERAAPADRSRPLLGLEEHALGAVALDFGRQSHLLILGDNECGKTATLRQLCREIVRTRAPGQAQLVIVDVRRGLLGAVESDHLVGYAMSTAALGAQLPDLIAILNERRPPARVTQRQLRDRSWWSGPEFYLVVDDYDLVATTAGNPLSPILEVLPHAKDVGLHLIVARRSGGAGRALFEPLLAGLRDFGCMTLVMSGNPDDAPLIGSARPVPRPPGRGVLVTRPGDEQLVQVSWSPP